MDELVAVTLLLQSGISVVTVMTFDIVEAVVLVHMIWYVLKYKYNSYCYIQVIYKGNNLLLFRRF